MLYTTITINDEEYKLRLNAKACIDLEKRLGKNPLNIFLNDGNMPLFSDLLAVFHASLQAYHHGIKYEDAADLYDKYSEAGGDIAQFTNIIMEIFKNCGFFPKEVETGKN